MYIKILRVYKDKNGRQIGVKADVGGTLYPRLSLENLYKRLATGDQAVNFIKTKDGVRGKNCQLNIVTLLSIDDMHERYKGKWVAVVDGRYKNETPLSPLLDGVVLAALTKEEYRERWRELESKGAVFEMIPGEDSIIGIQEVK